MIAALATVLSAIAVVASAVAIAQGRRRADARTHARTHAELENGAGHTPIDGVCPGSHAGTPGHTPEPAIVAGVRPDGGGTTVEHDAPALGWRPEILELIERYEAGADPPSRFWEWGGRATVVKPVAGGIQIQARGDCYLVITRAKAVVILQAQAVDLYGDARAWADHWIPRVHGLLFGEVISLAHAAVEGWRGTGLHLCADFQGCAWPELGYLHSADAWSGRGAARQPDVKADGHGQLARLEIGDATRSQSFARAYNKSAELDVRREKTGETLRARWRANGWNRDHGPVYRVEGGLRGKALRLDGLDLTDPAVLFDPDAHVRAWAYMFGHPTRRKGLIRLLDPTDTARPKDRRVHPIWRAVQAAAAQAPALPLTQVRAATEAEEAARCRRATASVRKGLATLAVVAGHERPRAAAAHARETAQRITDEAPAWAEEIDLARANNADLREAHQRHREAT